MAGSGQHSLNGSFTGREHPYENDFSSSRNASSSSLRSRSTTGDSGLNGMAPVTANGRHPPPRFPTGSVQQPQLALRTQQLVAQSPAEYPPNESYFSPVDGSPNHSLSSRTSAGSGMYPFPRQQLPQNGYYEEGQGHGTRFTAPAIGRQREPSGGAPTSAYPPSARPGPPPQRPGMGMHSSQQLPGPPRNRSASSPDIHNNPRGPGPRGMNGTPTPPPQPPVPDVPLPYQQNPHMIPRSQSNSPNLPGMANGMLPPQRGMSPQMIRERAFSPQPRAGHDPSPASFSRAGPYLNASRTMTPLQEQRDNTFSPPPPPPTFIHQSTAPAALQQYTQTPQQSLLDAPTQLKVRVHCDAASQVLTLVVPLNISCQSLKDRIDAKLQRSTQLTLASGGNLKEGQVPVKLKFLDEDDFVSIQSDDDVQTAFETWREQHADARQQGGMEEVELYCR